MTFYHATEEGIVHFHSSDPLLQTVNSSLKQLKMGGEASIYSEASNDPCDRFVVFYKCGDTTGRCIISVSHAEKAMNYRTASEIKIRQQTVDFLNHIGISNKIKRYDPENPVPRRHF